jgi:hypothetical protein
VDFNTPDQEIAEFIASLKLSMYNDMKDYLYIEVILALCKKVLVESEIQMNLALHPD